MFSRFSYLCKLIFVVSLTREKELTTIARNTLIHVKCINNYIIVPTYLSLQFLGLIPTPPVSP